MKAIWERSKKTKENLAPGARSHNHIQKPHACSFAQTFEALYFLASPGAKLARTSHFAKVLVAAPHTSSATCTSHLPGNLQRSLTARRYLVIESSAGATWILRAVRRRAA